MKLSGPISPPNFASEHICITITITIPLPLYIPSPPHLHVYLLQQNSPEVNFASLFAKSAVTNARPPLPLLPEIRASPK